MTKRLITVAGMLGVAVVFSASGQARVDRTSTSAEAIPGQYIVVLQTGVDARAAAGKHRARYGADVSSIYQHALAGYAARLTPAALEAVQRESAVAFVSEDEMITAAGAPDPVVPPPPSQVITRNMRRIDADESKTADYDGVDEPLAVDIAILDTGVDTTHPDLNVVGGVNCASGRDYDDRNGHGSHVAGIAALRDNAIGGIGVAPGARVWSVRVLNDNGNGTKSSLLCGLDWLTANAATLQVANMSLYADAGRADDGNCGRTNADVIHQAICRAVAGGVTITVAAGNDSADAAGFSPAAYDEVITVSAMTDTDGQPGGLGPVSACNGFPDDAFALFSNYGADVDLAAPGECISSAYSDGRYANLSGTSMAAPHVAGAAALYRLRNPLASPARVKAALIALAEEGPIPGDPDPHAEGIVNCRRL